MEWLQQTVLALVEAVGTLGIFLALFAGNLGVPLATQPVMILAGGLVAAGVLPGFWPVVLAAVLGEVAGQTVLYTIGRLGGEPFAARFGRRVGLDAARLTRAHELSLRHGRWAVFLGRFLPAVRNVIGLGAGVAAMPLAAFEIATASGSFLVVVGLAALGAAVAEQLDRALGIAQGLLGAVLAALVIAGLGAWLWRRRRKPAGTV